LEYILEIRIEQIHTSAACYAMRSFKPFMPQETLKVVYCAYFHSIMNCWLLLWRTLYITLKCLKYKRMY